ncbi:MAG: hypothetical protein SPJ39_06460 [Prevotella sp.]|nr:hypothetical protein [Prevotella sp.]
MSKCLHTLTLLVAFVATALHAQAQAKTAYGMLCYDEKQVRIPNSFVSLPFARHLYWWSHCQSYQLCR